MSERLLDPTNSSEKDKSTIVINSEDDVIKYFLMPSLQHASMSIIIITIWNQADIKNEIVTFFNEHKDKSLFSKIVDKVLDKVLQLPVPSRLRKIFSNFATPIGNEIVNWVEYHDIRVFYTYNYRYSKSMAINYIDYIVWTVRGVIDYKETAKILLAKEKKLSVDHKYNIACEYCLEDYIRSITPNVINTLILIDIKKQTMVYFWTAHITGNLTKLSRAVDYYNEGTGHDYSINECIFGFLIRNAANKVAIQYIWNKLDDEEKSRILVPGIVVTSNFDVRCFLLSQMNKEQEKEVFTSETGYLILEDFLNDWLWGHYFLPTVHHIWDIMPEGLYVYILDNIVDKMIKNYENSAEYNENFTFKQFWKYTPKNLKEYAFERSNGFYVSEIFLDLFKIKNKEMCQLLLADINDEQKKQIIFSEYGFELCSDYLISNKWDLLEMLIGDTLFSREDVECFKQRLVNEKGKEMAKHLIRNQEWYIVEKILQWAFVSVDIDINELNLVDSKIFDDSLESILENNKSDLLGLEHFFKCCSSSNVDEIVKCKAKIPELYFITIICKLISEDKYELLEQILNWCFTNDRKQIAELKYKVLEYDSMYAHLLSVNLIKRDDQLQSIKKFICWYSTNEANKLKTRLLYTKDYTFVVCILLLRQEMFKLADEFVNLCCISSQEIDEFKNNLMIHDAMVFLYEKDVPSTFCEKELLKWLNPSTENIKIFKQEFKYCRWFQNILPALDNYAEEQQCNQDKLNKDIADVVQDLISDVIAQDEDIIQRSDVKVDLAGAVIEDTS